MKKKLIALTAVIMMITATILSGCGEPETLKDAYKDYFPIGAAINAPSVETGLYDGLITQFGSLTAENEMKWAQLQPSRGDFNFKAADDIVAYAKERKMLIRGHALVWHSSMPTYIHKKVNGTTATKAEMIKDIKDHIATVVPHFGDDLYCWDVVNEVIDDGSKDYRESEFYKISGTEYIEEAFKAARAANPNIKLFYNDYEMINPVKRAKTIKMIKMLQDKNIPIDGIGMQAHYSIHNFNFVEFEKAIEEFAELGLEVQITELDFSVYQSDQSKQYDFLSDELAELQARCYQKLFEIVRKHKDKVTGVTLWGVADDASWLDNFPTKNRKNYPLLFDIFQQPKPAFDAVLKFKD